MQNIKYILILVGALTIYLSLMSFDDGKDIYSEEYNVNQNISSVPMPTYPTLGGDPIPLNVDTRERLERELTVNTYWQSNTLLNIKKANKYFPVMERVLAEEGVPDDFKYLAVIESDLRNVTSSANARGFWQFRKLAAKEMDLEVNSEVDERYHLEKSTRAAARYLKKLKNRFGSWTNAAAAYNMGPTNLSKQMTAQGADSYFDLNLGAETSRYVFRIVAVKEILSNPEKYGFYVDDSEKYPPLLNYYEKDITTSVPSWATFAKENGITYKMLKYYNPWLRDTKLTVKKNRYKVKIPK